MTTHRKHVGALGALLAVGAAGPAVAPADPATTQMTGGFELAPGALARSIDAAIDPALQRRRRNAERPRLRLTRSGRVAVAGSVPRRVRDLIKAANRIALTPYLWGGGHGSWRASGYDCSGSVGYALHGARLLRRPTTSGALTSFGRAGSGRWVTVYAHGGHTYMTVGRLRFDTSARKSGRSRWTRATRGTAGYVARHPAGL